MLSIGALIFPAGGICRVLGASIKMSWADVEMAEGEGEGEEGFAHNANNTIADCFMAQSGKLASGTSDRVT